MHHAVTVRAKQHEVFQPRFATRHEGMDRFDVMRFDEAGTAWTISSLKVKGACFAL